MLGQNDKVTFTLLNIRNKEGKIVHNSIKLPLEGKLDLPDDVYRLSVFESYQGIQNVGFIAFEIIVGKKKTIKEVFSSEKNVTIECPTNFDSIHDYCVCEETDKDIKIVSPCESNDLVVSNVKALKKVIKFLSAEVEVIKIATNKIKELRK